MHFLFGRRSRRSCQSLWHFNFVRCSRCCCQLPRHTGLEYLIPPNTPLPQCNSADWFVQRCFQWQHCLPPDRTGQHCSQLRWLRLFDQTCLHCCLWLRSSGLACLGPQEPRSQWTSFLVHRWSRQLRRNRPDYHVITYLIYHTSTVIYTGSTFLTWVFIFERNRRTMTGYVYLYIGFIFHRTAINAATKAAASGLAATNGNAATRSATLMAYVSLCTGKVARTFSPLRTFAVCINIWK